MCSVARGELLDQYWPVLVIAKDADGIVVLVPAVDIQLVDPIPMMAVVHFVLRHDLDDILICHLLEMALRVSDHGQAAFGTDHPREPFVIVSTIPSVMDPYGAASPIRFQ